MTIRTVLLCLLLSAASLISVAAQSPSVTRPEKWDAFAREFVESYLKLHPDFAVYLGRHEFDGLLPDWSQDGLNKQSAWLHQQRDSMSVFDGKSLDTLRNLEYELILSQINSDLFWLEEVKQPYRDPTFYSLNPSVYVTRAYAPLETRLLAYVRFAGAVPRAVEQVKQNLHPPLARPFIDIGETISGGFTSYFQNDVPAVFGEVRDTVLQQKFRAANIAAIRAMNDLTTWFERQKSTATDSFALGPGLFSEMLKVNEQVTLPLTELEKIGRQDLERNLAALKEACAQYNPGKSVRDCIMMEETDKPMGDLLVAAQKQLTELKEFIASQKIASIPGTEDVVVRESPPYMRWNSASINIPGPFEKNLPSMYYITLPDPSWSQKARLDYIPGKATLLFTSVHEVWPGHFLQSLHARQCPSTAEKIFGSYAFVEGWAHYAEEMMWDEGLHQGDPEAHIGQLKEALLRDVRYLSALGLHTGGMTVQQSEQMFREKAFQDSANAHQQALRGTFDPEYLNYTLGKLMIRQLRDDWCATRGGRKAWGQFHDLFLSYGAPPIPLVREIMLGPKSGPVLKPISQ
jgi:uncharacterized protein (DUF885 family)